MLGPGGCHLFHIPWSSFCRGLQCTDYFPGGTIELREKHTHEGGREKHTLSCVCVGRGWTHGRLKANNQTDYRWLSARIDSCFSSWNRSLSLSYSALCLVSKMQGWCDCLSLETLIRWSTMKLLTIALSSLLWSFLLWQVRLNLCATVIDTLIFISDQQTESNKQSNKREKLATES